MAKHILLIDDTKDILRLMTMMLEEDNHTVTVMDNGHGVIENARDISPDIIILDLRLGDISGINVLKDLKATTAVANIPVVVYTASILDAEKVQEMIKQEPTVYDGTRVLQKPFALDQLLDMLK